MALRKIVEWKRVTDTALQQLVELSQCSNAKLYSTGVGLGLINPVDIKSESFHYHVDKRQWRENVTTHYKKDKQVGVAATPDLSGCRLGSSARIHFSVRLIPIALSTRVDKKSTSEAGVMAGKASVRAYGVLGVVQELCSGLLRAEILLNDATERNDICALSEDVLVDFIARSISLPALKCAAIHFPSIKYEDLFKIQPSGLIGAWLGVTQSSASKIDIETAFQGLAEKIIKKGSWGPMSNKIRPDLSLFRMDFPSQQESNLLDLEKPCGTKWAANTLSRELNKRLNEYNLSVAPGASLLSPTLKLWIARLCFYPSARDDEEKQKASLTRFIKAVCYGKGLESQKIKNLQNIGIAHLNANTYPTTK